MWTSNCRHEIIIRRSILITFQQILSFVGHLVRRWRDFQYLTILSYDSLAHVQMADLLDGLEISKQPCFWACWSFISHASSTAYSCWANFKKAFFHLDRTNSVKNVSVWRGKNMIVLCDSKKKKNPKLKILFRFFFFF